MTHQRTKNGNSSEWFQERFDNQLSPTFSANSQYLNGFKSGFAFSAHLKV
jgi:hypothetical protein